MQDRYGQRIESFDPVASEVFMESGEILDRNSHQHYADAGCYVYHGDGLTTRYRHSGLVQQMQANGEVFTMQEVGAVIERVIDLWDSEGGWIPGASRSRLARALGVPVDRLRTAQQLKADRVNTGYLEV